MNVVIVY